MQTDGKSLVSYKYGTSANQVDTTVGDLDAGTYNTNGAITLTVSNARVGSSSAGQTLSSVNGVAYMLVGVVLFDIDDTSSGAYTLVGSASCAGGGPSPTPTPMPTPTPSGTPDACATSFSIHMSPAGFGDSWGEPSIGVNWKTEQV